MISPSYSRERVRLALQHQEPDRVPMDLGGTAVSTIHLDSYIGLLDLLDIDDEQPVMLSQTSHTVEISEAVRCRLGVDFVGLRPGEDLAVGLADLPRAFVDEWGVLQATSEDAGERYFAASHPLAGADLAGIQAYPLPDLGDPARVAGLRARAARLYQETGYALVADGMWPILQRAFDLRGMADFMMDMASDERMARALLDRLTETVVGGVRSLLSEVGEYVEVVTLADDLGTQSGPMMSAAMYRKYLKPCHKAVIEEIRKHTRASVFLHSDGAIRAFLPDLIDAGIQIVNPVQASAHGMDPARLKDEYGRELCFWGGVDTQHIMPYGSPDDVVGEVRRRIDEMAPSGGFILGAVHIIQYDVPPENTLELFAAGLRHGRYPRAQ